MRLDSNLQIEATNLGLDAQALGLLIYINSNWYLEEVKGIDLQHRYPLLFKSSVEVKKSFDLISEAGFVTGNYVSGIIKDIELNKVEFHNFFTSNQTVIKREKVKKEPKAEMSSDVTDIVKFYNTFPEMPRPAKLTASNKSILNDKLKSLPREQIIDAIKYADSARWIKAKLDETWMNMNWILRNIEGFCEGGKYRTTTQQTRVDNYTKSDMEDIVTF